MGVSALIIFELLFPVPLKPKHLQVRLYPQKKAPDDILT